MGISASAEEHLGATHNRKGRLVKDRSMLAALKNMLMQNHLPENEPYQAAFRQM